MGEILCYVNYTSTTLCFKKLIQQSCFFVLFTCTPSDFGSKTYAQEAAAHTRQPHFFVFLRAFAFNKQSILSSLYLKLLRKPSICVMTCMLGDRPNPHLQLCLVSPWKCHGDRIFLEFRTI